MNTKTQINEKAHITSSKHPPFLFQNPAKLYQWRVRANMAAAGLGYDSLTTPLSSSRNQIMSAVEKASFNITHKKAHIRV